MRQSRPFIQIRQDSIFKQYIIPFISMGSSGLYAFSHHLCLLGSLFVSCSNSFGLCFHLLESPYIIICSLGPSSTLFLKSGPTIRPSRASSGSVILPFTRFVVSSIKEQDSKFILSLLDLSCCEKC